MPAREVALLVNAAAGRGRGARLAGAVASSFHDGGLTVRVLAAATRADAEQQVSAAVTDGVAAVAALVTGRTRRVDAVRTGDRWWATVLCCGFDSAVSERADRLRWPRGPRRYDVAIAAELLQLRPRPVTVTVDGVPSEHEVTLVGNTPCYGGGLRICPGAGPDDGLLEVVVVGPVSRRELVRTRPRLAAGTHVDHPAVTVLRGREVRLAGTALVTYADGEPVAPLPVTSGCVPRALTVVGAAAG